MWLDFCRPIPGCGEDSTRVLQPLSNDFRDKAGCSRTRAAAAAAGAGEEAAEAAERRVVDDAKVSAQSIERSTIVISTRFQRGLRIAMMRDRVAAEFTRSAAAPTPSVIRQLQRPMWSDSAWVSSEKTDRRPAVKLNRNRAKQDLPDGKRTYQRTTAPITVRSQRSETPAIQKPVAAMWFPSLQPGGKHLPGRNSEKAQ